MITPIFAAQTGSITGGEAGRHSPPQGHKSGGMDSGDGGDVT